MRPGSLGEGQGADQDDEECGPTRQRFKKPSRMASRLCGYRSTMRVAHAVGAAKVRRGVGATGPEKWSPGTRSTTTFSPTAGEGDVG
jgi:hypothetical protein